MNAGIAIFVKTPGHSPVKTRLAAQLGADLARQWYERAALASYQAAQIAAAASNTTVYWAVAEANAHAHPLWAGVPVLAQGEGGLGERMHQVHRSVLARHHSALLIGADLPHFDPQELNKALDWLAAAPARLALGPAHDGGFWLFGSNQAIDLQRWQQVRYSASDTALQFRAALAHCGDWLTLRAYPDVDTAADLPACLAHLSALGTPTPAQSALQVWMQTHCRGPSTALV